MAARAVHLVVRGEIVCASEAARPMSTDKPHDYTCTRCGKRLCDRPQLVNLIAQVHQLRSGDVPIRLRRRPEA